jgi:hypothetical protein
MDTTIRTSDFIEVTGGTLVVLAADTGLPLGTPVRIGAEPCIVGRGERCHVVLNDLRVSTSHCAFAATDRGVVLEDLDSRNSSGPLDAFVTSFASPQAVPAWTFTVSGTGIESDIRLASDAAGRVYVTGTFTENVTIGGKTLSSAGGKDVFVLRLSTTGSIDWVRSFGGTGDDVVVTLASTPTGQLALTGDFFGTVDFGGGPRASAGGSDISVATYNADGSYRWDHTYGGPMSDFGQSVAFDSNESVCALALFVSSVDFGAGLYQPGAGTQALLRYAP